MIQQELTHTTHTVLEELAGCGKYKESVKPLSNCTCKFDRTCKVHMCSCQVCARGCKQVLTCSWRKLHEEFYNKHLSEDGKQQYQKKSALAAWGTHAHTARTVDMLNLLNSAYGKDFNKLGILDRSQSITMTGLQTDGTTGTIATSAMTFVARLWSSL